MTPGALNWILLFSLAFIWGGSFLGVEIALRDFGPFVLVAGRIALGAVTLLGIAYARGLRLPGFADATERKVWRHCLGMALFSNALPFMLISWGQQSVTSSFAGIAMAAVPLFVLPIAHFILPGERMGLFRVVGFLLGFAGVVVLAGLPVAGDGAVNNLARLACIAGSACYAIGGIITRLTPPVHPLVFGSAALLIASVIMVPLALAIEGVPTEAGGAELLALLYLGLLPTGIATLFLVRIVNTAGPVFLSLVNYMVPVNAVLIGWLVLAEPLPGSLLLSLGLILIGMAISQWRHFRKLFGL